MRHFFRVLAACLALMLYPFSGFAQDVSTYQEEHKLIRAPRSIGVLGDDLFGDKTNYYSGSLEFVQTDVSLPGNDSLAVSIGRRLGTGSAMKEGRPFGAWEFDIPHLHGIFSSAKGWATGSGSNPNLRCSQFGAPPAVTGGDGYSTWHATEYWHGSFLYIPGMGDQEMLRRSSTNSRQPSDGANYPVVTSRFWSISCIPSLAAGSMGTGEGFVAVSPDGIRYQFDWLVQYSAPKLTKGSASPIRLIP